MTTLPASARSILLSAAEVGAPLQLRRGDILFRQNQDARALFLLERGLVKLTREGVNGRQQLVTVNGSHQLVGEECICGGSMLYRSQAECLADVVAYQIPVQTFARLYGIPDFVASLVGYTICRNMDFVHRADLLVSYDVGRRILHGLAELAHLAKPASDGTSFLIPMTQAEIAGFVGATRETTSTVLSQLQKRGLISLSRRLVTTPHPDILLSAAQTAPTQTMSASNQ